MTCDKLQGLVNTARAFLSAADKLPDGHRYNSGWWLATFNQVLSGHGVDVIWQGNDKPSCRYVDMGDAYARTIVHDDANGFRVMSWGDWIEEQEARGFEYN